MIRHYLHRDDEAAEAVQAPGTFTEWERLPPDTDLLFYEGLHGAFVGDEVNIASHTDLLIGVTPVINLEWIQKLKRDTDQRGYRPEEVAGTILLRLPHYVPFLVPHFSRPFVHFLLVPFLVTSFLFSFP